MDKKNLALTIDVGTQSARAALIDTKGDILGLVKSSYENAYYSDKPGYAEQDPDYYFEKITYCVTKLCSVHQDLLGQIAGASITTFRDTSVQLDKDLKPLRKSILWLDQRMAALKDKGKLLDRIIFNLVGMGDTIKLNKKRTVAIWLKENEPELWNKIYKYVNISGYLTYKLTGNLVDSSASVTGHFPIDFKSRKWRKENSLMGRVFGIPNRMLCELKDPGELLGVISDEFAEKVGLPKGIKLISTGSDKACETVGLGVLSPETASISYGTASTIEVTNPKYHEPEPFLPAYPASVKDFYNMEVQIYRGYWMLTWFSKEFANDLIDEAKIQKMAIEEILNSHLSSVPPGSDGLVLQPYWGPGLSRPLAKGAIIGFTDIHTRIHLYRAVIEGIAYALREGLESIEHSQRRKVKKLMISGGGSQSDAICQITADIFGLPVYRVQTFETSSLGAAISCFVGLGVFKSAKEATEAMSHEGRVFTPNPIAHEQYEYLYNKVYLKLYPRLKHVYHSIKKFGSK